LATTHDTRKVAPVFIPIRFIKISLKRAKVELTDPNLGCPKKPEFSALAHAVHPFTSRPLV
jgi:hypothetical protein